MFVSSTRFFAATSALALTLLSSSQLGAVDAHGYVTSPMTEFKGNVMYTKYSATMSPAFSGKFDDSPSKNVETFTKAFEDQKSKPGGFASLRDLVKNHGEECGMSNPDATPKPFPMDGAIVWQNPDTKEGFVPSHTGPCEVWLDDTLAFENSNCAGKFVNQAQAHIELNKDAVAACKSKGKCMMRFFWLALHEPTWQIYKNCIPMTSNGEGGSTNTNNNGGGNAKVSNEYDTEANAHKSGNEYADSTTESQAVAQLAVMPPQKNAKCEKIKRSLRK